MVRLALLTAGVWILQLLLSFLLPGVSGWVDLMFLLLLFIGLKTSPGRFLWIWGLGLGFLRDLASGAPWGGHLATFALVGLWIQMGRHLVELDDWLVVGVSAGVLAVFQKAFYTAFLLLTDSSLGLTWGWWFGILLTAWVQGILAVWLFPRLSRCGF